MPREVAKPRGSELWYRRTDMYAGKILRVTEGHKLSVRLHEQKDATSYLLSGRLVLEQGESTQTMRRRVLEPGAVWRNAPKVVHAIEALEDSVTLEISTPELEIECQFPTHQWSQRLAQRRKQTHTNRGVA